MLLGSALAFMMSVTALSLPEAMILKKNFTYKTDSYIFTIIGFGIICIGYIFNTNFLRVKIENRDFRNRLHKMYCNG